VVIVVVVVNGSGVAVMPVVAVRVVSMAVTLAVVAVVIVIRFRSDSDCSSTGQRGVGFGGVGFQRNAEMGHKIPKRFNGRRCGVVREEGEKTGLAHLGSNVGVDKKGHRQNERDETCVDD